MIVLSSFTPKELVSLIEKHVGARKIIDLQFSTILAHTGKPMYSVFVITE